MVRRHVWVFMNEVRLDDPHLRGAHGTSPLRRHVWIVARMLSVMLGGTGDRADFKGDHRAVYNALSARNLSLNIMIEHDTFRTPYSKLIVKGSWVRAAFHSIRTHPGRLLQLTFHARDPHRAVLHVREAAGMRSHAIVENQSPYVVDNVHIRLRNKVLIVSTGQWLTSAKSTIGAPHLGKLRMQIEVKPTYAVDYDVVAPHGVSRAYLGVWREGGVH